MPDARSPASANVTTRNDRASASIVSCMYSQRPLRPGIRINAVPEPLLTVNIVYFALGPHNQRLCLRGLRRSALVVTTVRLVNSIPQCLACLECVLNSLERFGFAAEFEKRFAFQVE